MRAAVYERFGGPDVIYIEERPRPTVGASDVLVRVYASTVSIADYRMRSADLPPGFGPIGRLMIGVRGPRHTVLGMDFAGIVEEVGPAVTRFEVGDRVIGMPGSSFGSHAEFVSMNESGAIALAPAGWSLENAVTLVFGGTTMLPFLRRAFAPGSSDLRGRTVLVNGASGSTGTAAVQLARHLGARVIGVSSARNLALVESLGAERVIDYGVTDFTKEQTYDVIVDCVGNAPFARVRGALNPGGALLLVVASLGGLITAPLHSRRSGLVVSAAPITPTAEDLGTLARLTEAGELVPVIDRSYEFDEIREAHRYVGEHRKRGNLVLRITPES